MLKNKTSNRSVFRKASPLVFAVLFCAIAGWGDQPPAKPSEYKIPPEAAAKANPVKPSEGSVSKGKRFYGYDCAMCHGKDGDGKGDMAEGLKNVTDFTKPDALAGRTDGELFYIIRNGKGDMPPEGDRAKDDDVWNLVNYVRSLAKK